MSLAFTDVGFNTDTFGFLAATLSKILPNGFTVVDVVVDDVDDVVYVVVDLTVVEEVEVVGRR